VVNWQDSGKIRPAEGRPFKTFELNTGGHEKSGEGSWEPGEVSQTRTRLVRPVLQLVITTVRPKNYHEIAFHRMVIA
jgi:hypothetical protein